MNRLSRVLVCVAACCVLAAGATLSLPAAAADVASLTRFLQQTQSAKARFSQVVMDRNYKKLHTSTGTMQFSRPGLFRWEYQKPYEQLIVGDGTRLWIYDKDLNQVTTRALAQALGSTPAALLAGSNDIEKSFTLASIGNQEGLDWMEATPKSAESSFQGVRLGFSKAGLEAMELRDSFGQITMIRFADVERNVKLPPEGFRFTPPAGAAVIRD